MLDWYENYYVWRIINRNERGRRAALFSPDLWNLYQRVLNDEDRTNNHAETASRKLNTEIGVQHSSLWSFTFVRKVQAGLDVFFNHLEAGKSPPKKLSM